MRLGGIFYSSQTGLGIQTKGIYDNFDIDKVLLVDLSQHNHMPIDEAWYPNARICRGIPSREDCEWLTTDIDIIIECETPLNFYLHDLAKQRDVKVIQIYNREFLDYFKNPNWPGPALLAAPTSWCLEEVKQLNIAPVKILRQPIDRSMIPYRPAGDGKTFVHVVGRPAVHDRNGTQAFISAAKKLGKDYNYKVYYQEPSDHFTQTHFEPTRNMLYQNQHLIDIYVGLPDNRTLYETGDILVLPRRYGGLCFPMLEALSAGMPVIMPDISPNSDLLPQEWLCNASYSFTYDGHTFWDVYDADVDSLAYTMENVSYKIGIYNPKANKIAESQSWVNLKPEWERTLCELLP